MSALTKAIVLSALKYGDTSLIVRLYTERDGLRAFMLKGILKRRKGGLRPGLFQPLTQLEVVCGPVRNVKLGYLKEALVYHPYSSLHSDVRKGALALFIAEVLTQAIREEEANPGLFTFLEHAFLWLDHHKAIANFHILFLLGLSRYLGFYPDGTAAGNPYFDLTEGAFCMAPGLSPHLSGPDLEAFRGFLGMEFDAVSGMKLSRERRRTLLGALMQYYEIHLHGFRIPRSLAVLDEVFY